MRRTPLLIAAVSLVAAATPAALLAHPSDGPRGKAPETHHPGKHKGPKGTLYLMNACVIAGVTEGQPADLEVKVLSTNRHMRDALYGLSQVKAKLDATTKIRLVGKARKAPEGSDQKRLPKVGKPTDLAPGDFVTIRYRVERGKAFADLGVAWKITDRGPFPKKCSPPDPKTETPPKAETPPTTTAPSL